MSMHLGDTRLLIGAGRERGLLRNQMAYCRADCNFSLLVSIYKRPVTISCMSA